MSESKTTIAPFTTIPENIDAEIGQLLLMPANDSLGAWLHELTKASGHMSTNDDMRWRLLILIWQVAEYNIEAAWPYLMWLNQNKPVMSEQLIEILAEALDDFKAHLRMAQWMAVAQTDNERLNTFLSEFQNLPIPYKTAETFAALLKQAGRPEIEPWLANYCRRTADQMSPYIRPWHLFAATWYTTCFNEQNGLPYLQPFCNNEGKLTPEANNTLITQGKQLNATSKIIQWVANNNHQTVKQVFEDFGHPDLKAIPATTFANQPNYGYLASFVSQAPTDATRFNQLKSWLIDEGINSTDFILDLACGPLAPQTHLFHSNGYTIEGVDVTIPPAYLPLTGIKQRWQRSKHVKSWQAETAAYYTALATAAHCQLNTRSLNIQLADVTRLSYPNNHFTAVVCCNYLQHAPNPNSLLTEAHRVLKSGGFFVADLAYDIDPAHTHNDKTPPPISRPSPDPLHLNGWSQDRHRAAITLLFTIKRWEVTQSDANGTNVSILAQK